MSRTADPLIKLGYRSDLLNANMSRWLDHFRWLSALMVAASHLRNMLMPDAGQLGPLAAVFTSSRCLPSKRWWYSLCSVGCWSAA